VLDIFIEDSEITSEHTDALSNGLAVNSKTSKYQSDDIITDPVHDSDDSNSTRINCLKCQLKNNTKDDRSNSNSGDENKTVNELKDLRICSHGS